MIYTITGATSFLGVELTQALLSQGHQVIAVCREGSHGLANLPANVQIVYAQIQEYGQLPSKIGHADVFIHLAWEGTGHGGREDVKVHNRNVIYTKEAMQAAAQTGCQLFVFAGSQAEYGVTNEPQQEGMACAPFSEYGKAKLRVWEECGKMAKELGMKYIHLRIFSLFGENDHPWTLVMSCVDKMLRNEPIDLSPCTQNWNFLYSQDAVAQIAQLCAYAMRKADFQQEIYQIASNDTRPLREFVERIRELTHSQSVLHYGAVQPTHLVSLHPNMTKLDTAIGEPITRFAFDEVINLIINKHHD